eukprot:TRINITY_DN24182_c0_g1_i1.p1 TRINITY_DN24182_c0_g1~~TRINITY_DN24182_c0_g1_i1.p1  ORF type:complete len:387 (+),score=51.33 TRINITY_DN24182_c0_g1_i1:157-1161(+)
MPRARWGHAMARAGRQGIVVHGGVGGGGAELGDCWLFLPRTTEWRRLKGAEDDEAAPLPRAMHTATHLGKGEVLVYGGARGPKRCGDTRVLELTDGSASWRVLRTAAGGAPPRRCGHSATRVGSSVVIFGGQASPREVLGDTHALTPEPDSEQWRWVQVGGGSEQPRARFNHSASSVDGSLWVVGGRSASGVCFDDCWELSCDSFSWRRVRLQGPPLPRIAGHIAAVLHGSVVLHGGVSKVSPDVWAVTPCGGGAGRTNQLPWATHGREAPEQRRAHAAVVCPLSDLGASDSGCSYCFVGFGGDSQAGPLADLFAVVVSAGEEIPPLPQSITAR